jgi:glycogen operon protein
LAGDELSHTQQGNNNTYCQDNELTWLDWSLNPERQSFLDFVRRVVAIRQQNPVLRRRRFFHGRRIRGKGIRDIIWLSPSGREMTDVDWNAGFIQSVGVFFAGDVDEQDETGQSVVGDNLLLLLNASHHAVKFTLPSVATQLPRLELLLNTAVARHQPKFVDPKDPFELAARSLVLFRWPFSA